MSEPKQEMPAAVALVLCLVLIAAPLIIGEVQQLRRVLPAESLLLSALEPVAVKISGGYRRSFEETLLLSDPLRPFAIQKVLRDVLTFEPTPTHGSWLIARTVTETLQLAAMVDTSWYGPFYGRVSLCRLGSDLNLQGLVSNLTLAQLRALLTLRADA